MEGTHWLARTRALTDSASCENDLLSMVTGARAGTIFRPRRPPRETLYGWSGRNTARGPRPRVCAGDLRGAVHRQPRNTAALGHTERPVSNLGGKQIITGSLRFEGQDHRVGARLSPDSESRGPPAGEPKGFPAWGRSPSARARF